MKCSNARERRRFAGAQHTSEVGDEDLPSSRRGAQSSGLDDWGAKPVTLVLARLPG